VLARRVVTCSVSLLAALGAAAAFAASAHADRDFTVRFSTNDTGNIAIVGNTLMTCPTAAANCVAAQNGTATGSALSNNAYNMQHIDADGDPATTLNSSRATLSLPAGSTVLFAGLYWGGRTSAGSGGQAAPNPAARGSVDFRTPGGVYTTLTASPLDDSVRVPNTYAGFADITSQVAAAGSGEYWAGDVQSGTGLDRHAGWALIVAYRDTAQPPRNLTVFDGFQTLSQGQTPLSMPLTGFRTPATGPVRSTLGTVVYEGDRGAGGDSATLDNQPISAPLTPATNFFNSTIAERGVPFTDKDPNFDNQLGFDAKQVSVDGLIANGATSATIRAFTTSEQFYPHAFTLATELFAPRIEAAKSVTPTGPAQRGDTLRYEVTFSNTGEDGAIEFVATDRIPAGTTFVPGSLEVVAGPSTGAKTDGGGDDQAEFDAANQRVVFRLGTGATAAQGGTIAPAASTTLAFEVTVNGDVQPGTEIVNQATADFFSETAGNALKSESPETTTTVIAPDLTISKTHAGDFVPGAATPFSIVVSNSGTAPTTGAVTVTDPFPVAMFDSIGVTSAPGWDCSATVGNVLLCTRADALAPAASYPPIVVDAVVADPAPPEIVNVAAVTGGGDETPANNFDPDVGPPTLRADLQITKTASADTVYSGERISFDLLVRNAGPSTANLVEVEDTLGAGYADVAVDAPPGVTCDTSVTCTIATLAPGATATITISATVTAVDDTLTNTATVTADNPEDPTPANNTSSSTFTVPPTADMTLTKTLSPANPTAGQTDDATYTLTITNNGPSDATGVEVTDPLPATFTASTITIAPASGFICNLPGTGGTLLCTGGAIGNGDDVTITVVGTFAASAEGQTIDNAARVTADQADGNTDNNDDADGALIIPAADVELIKTAPAAGSEEAPAAAIVPGGTANFGLRVVNHGPSDATGVVVTDTLPAGLELVSASAGCTAAGATVTCAVGTLASAAAVDLSLTVRAAAGTAGQTLENVASATADQPDPVPSNNEGVADITVGQPPVQPPPPPGPTGADVSIAKTASPSAARLGRVLTYTLTVTNAGPATATGVRVADALTGRADVLSARASQGTCTRRPAVGCELGDIAAGGRATITIRVRPMRTGDLTNAATVTATSTDPNAANNRAEVGNRVRAGSTRVSVSKTASTQRVRGGQRFSYRIAVRSRGPATAVDLRVCDRPPSALVLVGAPGARVRGGRACWTVRRLDEGKRRTFTLTVRATALADAERVTNTVRVRGDNVRAVAAQEAVRVAPGATACPAVVRAYAAC
jgi:uncharacterized repeat protein (TIGR01451 family)